MRSFGSSRTYGPLLVGLSRPVQIVPMNAHVSDILNMAAIAAHDAVAEGPEIQVAAE